MNLRSFLLFIALFSSFAYSAQTPLQKFLASSFEPDQAVNALPLFSQGNYVLVGADGVETYVVDVQTGKPLSGADAISSILVSDAANRSGFDAKYASAASLPSEINAAKGVNEAKCMQLTGTDLRSCTDRQSCILACISVPQCGLEGGIVNAPGFPEALADWNVKRMSYSEKLSQYSAGIEAIKSDPAALSAKASLLSDMLLLAENMSRSPIFLNKSDTECHAAGFTCYEYCPKIDYSSARIASGRQTLLSMQSTATSIQQQPARAAAILAAGKANDAYLARRMGDYQSFRVKMAADLAKLNTSAAQLAKKVDDPQIAPSLSGLYAISAEVKALGDGGFYHQAISKQPSFESGYNATSNKIANDLSEYKQLTDRLDSTADQAQRAEGVVGANSSASYLAQIAEVRQNLTSPVPISGIAPLKAKADAIKDALSSEIADKVTNSTGQPLQVPTSIPSKLPCLPALVLLALLGYAFARVS